MSLPRRGGHWSYMPFEIDNTKEGTEYWISISRRLDELVADKMSSAFPHRVERFISVMQYSGDKYIFYWVKD